MNIERVQTFRAHSSPPDSECSCGECSPRISLGSKDDLSGVEHLFQVRAEGLAVEFPPLRTVDTVPGNLPAQATSFVGREDEVKELSELVRGNRLVTSTGVGGVGKTRLAVQVAAELVPEFAEGVWLVELAPVGDPGAVPDAAATALGITPQPGKSVTGQGPHPSFGHPHHLNARPIPRRALGGEGF